MATKSENVFSIDCDESMCSIDLFKVQNIYTYILLSRYTIRPLAALCISSSSILYSLSVGFILYRTAAVAICHNVFKHAKWAKKKPIESPMENLIKKKQCSTRTRTELKCRRETFQFFSKARNRILNDRR